MRRTCTQALPGLFACFFPIWLSGCDLAGKAAPLPFSCTGLPPLPAATAGALPAGARAGRLTMDNYAQQRVPGPTSLGLIGDYYLANDQIRVVVQQPGRALAPLPYGGNIIDLDFATQPVGDQFGEVGLFLMTGRTANFTRAEVLADGAQGGPAALRFYGTDAHDDYINMLALGQISSIIQDEVRPDVPLGLQVAATYTLQPGASVVEVQYTLCNPSAKEIRTSWGTMTDSGGEMVTFHPGTGSAQIDLTTLFEQATIHQQYMAQGAQGVSYGVIPVSDLGGVGFPVAGVSVDMYDVNQRFDVFNRNGLTVNIPPGGVAQRQVHVAIARGGIDGIERVVREIQQRPLQTITGVLTGTVPGEVIHVEVSDATQPAGSNAYTDIALTGAAGATQTPLGTQLPVGQYVLQPIGAGQRQGPAVPLTVADHGPLTVSLSLPAPARLDYRVLDMATGATMPGKISIIGKSTLNSVNQPAYAEGFPGLVAVQHSLAGDSSLGTSTDHPLYLLPGTYRVVVSRGPEWTASSQQITLGAGQMMQISAPLAHAVPTPGYLACDFHQHSFRSPDSRTSPEHRVATYVAEGVDFISSADHDVVGDYAPIIQELGVGALLGSAIGEEMTPFGYGHFIGWPLVPDPLSPNGGAFDWGGGEGPDVSPSGIYAGIRARGAQVVQVNHPRMPAIGGYDFQKNFDVAVLRFDFGARTFYGDRTDMLLPSAQIGLPEDAAAFAGGFDTLEVTNGSLAGPPDGDGERQDPQMERILRDWMNFLSFGFLPTAVGDSDSHGTSYAGVPRTLVRVPHDTPDAPGIAEDVARTVAGLSGAPRDVVVTNAPFLQLYVGGDPVAGGLGRVVTPNGGKLVLHVEARSPEWAPINTLEVFANNTFDIPGPAGAQPAPMVPAVCFTSRTMMPARCAQALVSGALAVNRVDEGQGKVYLLAHIDVELDVQAMLQRGRAGGRGSDLWLVARTFGDQAMYPVVPDVVDPEVDIAQLIAGTPLISSGDFPVAITNPVLVDVDGGGWRAPFQP